MIGAEYSCHTLFTSHEFANIDSNTNFSYLATTEWLFVLRATEAVLLFCSKQILIVVFTKDVYNNIYNRNCFLNGDPYKL